MRRVKISLDNYAYAINNLFEFSGLEVSIMSIEFKSKDKIAVLTDCLNFEFHVESSFDFDALLSGNVPLTYVSSFDMKRNLPVFFEVPNKKKVVFDFIGNVVYVNCDILTITFILLSRIEEIWTCEHDEFSRFKSKNSLAVIYDFLNYPLVDEYANLLRKYCVGLNIPMRQLKVSLIPTHDIDVIKRFNSSQHILRTILGDFVSLSFRDILKLPFLLFKHFMGRKDQYFLALEETHNDSRKRGFTSKFFFMSSAKSNYDEGYDLESINSFLQTLDPVSICLHPSFYTFNNEGLLKEEQKRFHQVTKIRPTSVRMHFLRFDISKTPKQLENGGIENDYSLGYAEKVGFRCGTSNDYFLYDFELGRASGLREFPLIAMDVTLFHYLKLTRKDAFNVLCSCFDEVHRLAGNFVVLWHNNYVNRKADWYEDVYLNFLDYAKEKLMKKG